MYKLRPDWRTFISSLLIVLSFPPWGYHFLIWFALIPYFDAVKKAPIGWSAFRNGVWMSFWISLGGFYWIAYVLHEFGNLPWIVSGLALALYSLAGQPQFLIFSPLLNRVFRIERTENRETPPIARRLTYGLIFALSLSFIYAGLDWVLPKLFVDTLGHAFYTSAWIRQLADLGGPPLITFLVFMVNWCLWLAWDSLPRTDLTEITSLTFVGTVFKALRRREIALAATLLILALFYGALRNKQVLTAIANAPSKVQLGVIQPNVGDIEKLASEHEHGNAADQVVSLLFGMSETAMKLDPKPEVIIWPETAYPSTFRTPHSQGDHRRDQLLEQFVHDRNVPLLFGGYDTKGLLDYNAFFALSPSRELQVYHKNMLLLFGEYIPGSDSFQFLKDAFPQVGNFGRGKGPEIFNLNLPSMKTPLKVNPVICYEALFPNYVLEGARLGSQFILNITNDSWFGPWGEPILHLSLISFRSIETRLPQIRSTNTGYSTLILPDGEIVRSTELFKPEIMNVSVPLIQPIGTLMLLWGDWFAKTALLVGAALMFLKLRINRRPRSGPTPE